MYISKSQHIYIDTVNCDGDPWNFKINIQHGHLKCDPKKGERLRISLVRWTCRYDWYSVRYPYSQFNVKYNNVTTNFVIPDGNYTYLQFADEIEILLNAQKTALGCPNQDISVVYNSLNNKITIYFPENIATPREITVHKDKRKYFGFTAITKTSGSTGFIQSDVPLDFYDGDERLIFKCEGLKPHGNRNITTSISTNDVLSGQTYNGDNRLASVLVNNLPYETIVFEDNGDMYGFFLDTHDFQGELKIGIFNQRGVYAEYLPDSHLVLRVDTYMMNPPDVMTPVLKNMEEYMRLMLISSHLGNGSAGQQ